MAALVFEIQNTTTAPVPRKRIMQMMMDMTDSALQYTSFVVWLTRSK